MNLQTLRDRLLLQEDLNFLLTNRIPRTRYALHGLVQPDRNPLAVRRRSRCGALFADLDLSEAKKQFNSLHDCFTRELKPGAAHRIRPGRAGKPLRRHRRRVRPGRGRPGHPGQGLPLPLRGPARPSRARRALPRRPTSRCGSVEHVPPLPRALRLHRREVTYISGDTWNVNPIALRRVSVCSARTSARSSAPGWPGTDHLVPVAAMLVASIRFEFADVLLHLRYRGPTACRAKDVQSGQEIGRFEHGSTIILSRRRASCCVRESPVAPSFGPARH